MTDRRFTQHFAVSELACRDSSPVPAKYYANAVAICQRAEVLRKVSGPLIVVSGYRSPAHNRKVNGAKTSQHLTASALDLRCPGVTAADLADMYQELIDRGLVPDGGLGRYNNWIHIDIGKARRW